MAIDPVPLLLSGNPGGADFLNNTPDIAVSILSAVILRFRKTRQAIEDDRARSGTVNIA